METGMASQMVVPASKDTLFMRGFSARREIDDIREFFSREGGRCTVEFFKESDDKSKLYVALKFDSKEVAKELLNKYDNTDVLGDRITISWFKDLRRARMKAGQQRRRFNWSPDRYGRSKDRYHSGSGSQRYGQNRWNNFGTRGRKFDRSSSRSRSRSTSRSLSRSPTPRRSRSRSNESPVEPRKHKRSRTTSDSRKEDKRSSEKSKRSGGHERASRDRSESLGREESMEEDDDDDMDDLPERRRSPEKTPPQSRSIKIIRSAVTTVDRQQRGEAPSDDESEDGRTSYSQPVISEDETDKRSIDNYKNGRHKGQENTAEHIQQHRLKKDSLTPEPQRRMFKDNAQVKEEASSKSLERQTDLEAMYRESDKGEKEKGEERFYHSRRYEREVSPPGHPMDRAHPPTLGPRFTDKSFREVEYPGRTFDHRRRSLSPPLPRAEDPHHAPRDPDRGLPPGGDYPNSPPHLRDRERDVAYNYRGGRERPDPRYEESPRELSAATPPPLSRGRAHPDSRDIRSPPRHEPDQSPDIRTRPKRPYDDDLPLYDRKIAREREYDEPRGPLMRRGDPEEYVDQPKRSRRYVDEGPPPVPRDMWKERDYYDERSSRMERPPQGIPPASSRMHPDRDRERSPYFDDRASTGTASSRNPGPPHSFNGGMVREVDKGALGLPQDKMMLVREKKEEIEKSYRQDCETFAAVTKMLISKDITLEEKLQGSLRENLKDIGQRCIHELRDFIDRLKSEDERRPLH